MKGQVRNIYPGGNTPQGFYSYYNHILLQRKAKKIFCIKGGPGTGKSTLMREIGNHFLHKGEDVDFLWCSSDPESVDGVLLKERAVALFDGTAPHIIDPKNPGAVDEIINLGGFWNDSELMGRRREIIGCGERISEAFAAAYGYLRCVGQQYEFMSEVINSMISHRQLQDVKRQLIMSMNSISVIRRTEGRIKKEIALGADIKSGQRKKAFAGAITPKGVRSELLSIIAAADKIIAIDVPVGFSSEILLAPAAERLTNIGFDIEEYYCPMAPQRKLEHIIVPQAAAAIVSCNKYHGIDGLTTEKKIMQIELIAGMESARCRGRAGLEEKCSVESGKSANEDDLQSREILHDLQMRSEENISRAVHYLKKAKQQHDVLESYYINNMDFERINAAKDKIITQIEALVVI